MRRVHPARAETRAMLRGYDRRWLRGDLVAGLTVWAVLVPESLAYESIAGVSPVVGLYAAPGALILYAALGSSRHLVDHRRAGDHDQARGAARRVAAARLPRQLHFRAGDQRVHRRARADDHRRPIAEAVQRR